MIKFFHRRYIEFCVIKICNQVFNDLFTIRFYQRNLHKSEMIYSIQKFLSELNILSELICSNTVIDNIYPSIISLFH